MKIKSCPGDFRVYERNQLAAAARDAAAGAFGVYVLTKEALTTPDAVHKASRGLGLPPGSFRYAGLKDRWAVTEQVVTVASARNCAASWPGLSLRPLGWSDRPVGPGDILANRFEIIVRALPFAAAEAVEAGVAPALAASEGADGACSPQKPFAFINYYDDQRFGSIRCGGRFAGEALVRRQWEQALFQLIAAPGPRDLPAEARSRRALAAHWGDWPACLAALEPERGPMAGTQSSRQICRLLAREPDAFRRAINLLSRDELAFQLVAYQSWMFNEMARELVRRCCAEPLRAVAGMAGDYILPPWPAGPAGGAGALDHIWLPTLGRGWERPEGVGGEVAQAVLAAAGLRPENFVVRGLSRYQLRSSPRQVAAAPAGLSMTAPEPDERHPGLSMVKLSFELPPGSYATMLLRNIFGQAPHLPDGSERDGEGAEADSGSCIGT